MPRSVLNKFTHIISHSLPLKEGKTEKVKGFPTTLGLVFVNSGISDPKGLLPQVGILCIIHLPKS